MLVLYGSNSVSVYFSIFLSLTLLRLIKIIFRKKNFCKTNYYSWSFLMIFALLCPCTRCQMGFDYYFFWADQNPHCRHPRQTDFFSSPSFIWLLNIPPPSALSATHFAEEEEVGANHALKVWNSPSQYWETNIFILKDHPQ